MPNVIKVTVENPDEILNTGAYAAGALVRLQWSATQAGAFADVSGTGSTPSLAIVTATRIYTGYDPAGIVSTWYRTRYENAGATRLSDWTPAFQVGDETAGLLCSIYDVKQELGIAATATGDDETILEKIKQVSVAIEGYTGRWLAPRPTDPASTTVYRMHTSFGVRLRVPKGIRTITTLGVAQIGQPESGGSYVTQTTGIYYIDPPTMERSVGWPGTAIEFVYPLGGRFYQASYGAEITGSFGFAAVPDDIQGVAVRAATRRFLGKGGGGVSVAVGPAGTEILLPDMSGADRRALDFYKDTAAYVG